MPHVYNHNDGITNMASIKDYINTTSPAFLAEYANRVIYDAESQKFFNIQNGVLTEIPPIQGSNYDYFSAATGLAPAGKESYQTSEAFRYSGVTPSAENNWAGLGSAGNPALQNIEYTGQTAGYTSGGVLLYQVKNPDGTLGVTSTPPPGQTAPAPITQEQMVALGPEVTTGGVVTPEAQAEASQPTTTPLTTLPTFKKGDITITPTSIDAQGNYITPNLGTFSEADLVSQGFTKSGVTGEVTPTTITPVTTAPITPTTAQKATLYGPNGQKEVVDVGSARASELQTQGWGLTEGSYKAPATPIVTPTTPIQKATLYGPNGQKEVVDVGSARASELQSQGWTLTEPPITPVTSVTPVAPTTPVAKATLYGPNGQKEVVDVGSARASELQSQGWTLTAPATSTTPVVPVTPATPAQKATLYGPNGQKEVVDVGSARASELQSQGWTLTEATPAVSPTPAAPAQIQKATLYGPNGQKEVVDVGSARASELQSQGWTLTAPATSATEPTYDPFEEAMKYGYSREDFANDPGFFDYWSKKTPELLKTALAMRSDWDTTTNKKKPAIDESDYDPFEEAAKYGYTRDELIQNDPNFESYWSKKTPEQLLAGLSARTDWDADTKKKKIIPPAEALQTIYGQVKQPTEVEELVGNFIGAAATSFLRNGGISQATFDKYVKNDPTQLAKYVNAMLYGGYDKVDYLFRDLKAKELADQGNAAYQNYKAFDETISASEWFKTPEGQKVLNDVTLAPPAGVINETLLNNTIFTIPNEAFSTLFEPIDINSPAFKAEAEKIQASYYDIMIQKAQAETEQQKAVADENYRIFTTDLNKKYGLRLSDNAQTAWTQLQDMFSGASQRGMGTSGLVGEAMDKYLADQRNKDQILRDEKITTQERETLNNLLKNGSSAEIQAYVTANPDKAKLLGLVPSTDVANWYSVANLKTLYPDMTDTEINNIRNSMIDENGNYRSDLYQTLEANRYGFGQDKQTYQQQKLEEQKILEAEKAYAPFTTTNPLSSYQGVKPTSATPTVPATPSTSTASTTTLYNPVTGKPFEVNSGDTGSYPGWTTTPREIVTPEINVSSSSTVKAQNPFGGIFDINPNEYESLYKSKGWTLI